MTNAKASAMGPVNLHIVPHRAAEERIHRDSARLGCDVDTGVLDRGDRLMIEPSRGELSHRVQLGGEPREGARVASGHEGTEREDHLGERGAPGSLREFRPPGDSFIRENLEKGERPPAPIGAEYPELADAHGFNPRGSSRPRAERARRVRSAGHSRRRAPRCDGAAPSLRLPTQYAV